MVAAKAEYGFLFAGYIAIAAQLGGPLIRLLFDVLPIVSSTPYRPLSFREDFASFTRV